MKLTNQNHRISFFEGTVSIFFPAHCKVSSRNSNTLEVSFSSEKYPILGVNVECLDAPKLNSIENIENFLRDGLEVESHVIRENDTFILNYDFKIDEEKLKMWKILHFLKPRSFRLVRFSLTWPNTNPAVKLANNILKELPKIIKSIKFSSERTKYDDIANLSYKLSQLKYSQKDFWNIIKINIPKKWIVEFSDDKSFVSIFMNLTREFYFFLESFIIKFNGLSKNNDEEVENFIQEITKEVNISNTVFKKSEESDYLFSFITKDKELNNNNKEVNNKIWYRIKVLKEKMVIVSFVFELSSNIDLENKLYQDKLDQIIGAAEIIV